MASNALRQFLWLYVLVQAVWPGPASYAQYPYQITTYNTFNGLSDNRVTCIFKDRTGYMWIGTENGLNRFDSHLFLVYKPGQTSRTISHAYINSIKQDQDGRLWIATQNGVNVLDPATDSVSVFLPDNNEEKGRIPKKNISSNLIWDLYIDHQERVWMAPDSRDLCYYDTKTKEFVSFSWLDFLAKQFPSRKNQYNSIRRIYKKSETEIWLGTSAGLFSMQTETGLFTWHPSLITDHFVQLYWDEGAQTAYFIQNSGSSLQVLSTKQSQKKEFSLTGIPPLKENEESNRRIWLPAGNQLLQIHPADGRIFKIAHETDDPASLPIGNMRTVYQDSTGVVWVGSNAGLSKFNARPDPFQYVPVFPVKNQAAQPEKDIFRTDHLIHTVLYDPIRSCYYLSSPENNQFIVFHPASGEKKIYSSINGIPLRNCSVLYKDEKGQIWIFANRRALTRKACCG